MGQGFIVPNHGQNDCKLIAGYEYLFCSTVVPLPAPLRHHVNAPYASIQRCLPLDPMLSTEQGGTMLLLTTPFSVYVSVHASFNVLLHFTGLLVLPSDLDVVSIDKCICRPHWFLSETP